MEGSGILVRPLQGRHINLFHSKHCHHGSLSAKGICVAQHRNQYSGNNLPRHSKFVLEPSALVFFSACGKFLSQRIDFLFGFAVEP
jgi:hypothetical protein